MPLPVPLSPSGTSMVRRSVRFPSPTPASTPAPVPTKDSADCCSREQPNELIVLAIPVRASGTATAWVPSSQCSMSSPTPGWDFLPGSSARRVNPGRGRGGTATELRRQRGVSLAGRHPSPRPRTAGGLRGALAPPRQTGDACLSRPWNRAVRGRCGYRGRTHRLGSADMDPSRRAALGAIGLYSSVLVIPGWADVSGRFELLRKNPQVRIGTPRSTQSAP